METIDISVFSPIFELAATLNVAFVAVEYAQSYTATLAQKMFKFNEQIESKLKSCLDKLRDKDTLDNMPTVNCGESDTGIEKEGVIREREKISEKAEQVKAKLFSSVDSQCKSKSHSSLSLFLFLFSVTIMLVLPYHSLAKDIWQSSFCWFMTFSSIYVITGWLFGEKSINHSRLKILCNYSSFKRTISVLLFALVLSVMLGYILRPIGDTVFFSLLIASTFLVFANFIAFIAILYSKSKQINKEIIDEMTPLEDTIKQHETKVADLMTVVKVARKISDSESVETSPSTQKPHISYRKNQVN